MNHHFSACALRVFPWLVVLVLLFACGEGPGQEGDGVKRWLAARDRAAANLREAHKKADKDAIREANQALIDADRQLLAACKRSGDKEQLARIQSELVVVLQEHAEECIHQRDVKGARAAWTDAEALARERYGADDWRTGDVRSALAKLDRLLRVPAEARGDLVESKDLHRKAVEAYQKGDYKGALGFGEKSAELQKKVLGGQGEDYAGTLSVLGAAHQALGQYGPARDRLTEMMKVLEAEFGKQHPQVALALNNLARVHKSARQLDEALKLYQKALAMLEATTGTQTAEYAQVLNNLAELYRRRDDNDRAEPLLRQALQIRKLLQGNDGAGTAESLHNLGSYLYDKRRYDEAVELLEQARRARAAGPGRNHPDYAMTLDLLALAYMGRGDFDKVEPLLIEAGDILRRSFGEDHPDYRVNRNLLADLYVAIGKAGKARTTRKPRKEEPTPEELAERKKVLAAMEEVDALAWQDHDLVKRLTRHREEGKLDLAVKATEEAVKGCQRSVELVDRHFAESSVRSIEEHNRLAMRLTFLAIGYGKLDRAKEARSIWQEVRQLRDRLGDDCHPVVISALLQAEKEQLQRSLSPADRKRLAEASEWGDRVPKLLEQVKYTEAKDLLEKTIAVEKAILGENHPDHATSLNNLAVALQDLGNYVEARKLLVRVLAIMQRNYGKKHPVYARGLNNLAENYRTTGELDKAEPLYLECLQILEKQGKKDSPEYVAAQNNLALLYSDTGRHPLAKPLLLEALKTLRARDEAKSELAAQVLNNLGTAYHHTGDLKQAARFYVAAAQTLESIRGDNDPRYATYLDNLGRVCASQGEHEKALTITSAALRTYEKILPETHHDYLICLGNLADAYQDTGKSAEAIKLRERLIQLCEKSKERNTVLHGNATSRLGEVYLEQGDFEQAEPFLTRAVAIFERSGGAFTPKAISALERLASLYTLKKQPARAVPLEDKIQRALRENMVAVLPRLSEARQIEYFRETHFPALQRALSLLQQDSSQALAEASAAWALNGKGVVSEILGERTIHLRMVNSPEVVRLRDSLRTVRSQLARLTISQPGQDVLPNLAEEHAQQIARVAAQEKDLAEQLAATLSHAPHHGWTELQEVRENVPPGAVLIEFFRYTPLTPHPKKPKWGAQQYAAWIIPAEGKGNVRLVKLGDAESIDTAVGKLQQAMRDAGKEIAYNEAEAETAIRRQLRSVAALVLSPLEEAVAVKHRWLISADSALWLVPWGALPLKSGEYAIERHAISYLVSGRELATQRAANVMRERIPRQHRTHIVLNGTTLYVREERHPTALGLVIADPDFNRSPGDRPAEGPTNPAEGGGLFFLSRSARDPLRGGWLPLRGSAAEARATLPHLQQYLKAEPSVFTGAEATEQRVLTAVAPRVLVLSTHGFFLPAESTEDAAPTTDSLNPLLRCGLVFAGANQKGRAGADGSAGILTGLELVDLDLTGTELVVLSACDTGVGSVRSGDGVIGLRHAFRMAGAEAVVATLWRIPDKESADLIVAFWKQLASGLNAADALRAAQLDMIKERRNSKRKAAHPYFWAGFTLTGQTTFPTKDGGASTKPAPGR
jgi:tetratricopeptide (TPR) repeat protein